MHNLTDVNDNLNTSSVTTKSISNDVCETIDCSKEKNLDKIEYDDLVIAAGEFGLFQVLLFFATCPLYVFGVFSYFSQLFMTAVPANHWCWIPELENLTQMERRTLAVPQIDREKFGYSHCRAYVADWKLLIDSGQTPNNSWATEACRYGWEYNNSEIPYPTISTEMNWVCERDSYQATAQSAYFIGSTVGGFLIGWIADRYGRIPAGITSNLIGCIAGVGSVFTPNFYEFSFFRFLMGISYDNCMTMMFLIILEYVSPKYRTVIANLSTGTFYTLGLVILPWIALACGHWKILGFVTSIPMAISALTFFIVPESPAWLLSKGRLDEAVNKLVHVGKINKRNISAQLIQKFKTANAKVNKNENSSISDLFRRPLLRCVLCCVCVGFMCCAIIFDALVRSIGSLSFDFFLAFTFMSLTEIPSILIVSFALDITGRKWLTILVLLMCSVFSILIPFVGNSYISVGCAVVARFGVNVAYITTLQWSAELLPTSVRGFGVSLVHICGYVATVLSPYIIYTDNYVSGLPLMIVAIVAFIGACSIIKLPETAGKEIPHTFEDAENMIKNNKFFDIPFLRK